MIGQLVQKDSPENRNQILAVGQTYRIKVPYLKAEK
jgi:hypothetical protein